MSWCWELGFFVKISYDTCKSRPPPHFQFAKQKGMGLFKQTDINHNVDFIHNDTNHYVVSIHNDIMIISFHLSYINKLFLKTVSCSCVSLL